MKRLLLISTCLFMAAPAFAQQASMQSPAYRECSTLANSNPSQALAKADAWLKMDTGIAAQHCRAMALYGMRRFGEAGDALTAVRDMIAPENITLRSYVARQASNALIGANRADQAIGLLGSQINDISTMRTDNSVAAAATSELLVERARININFGKLDEAAKDLDHAVSLTPTNESVLMERAGVFEKLGDLPLARNDLKSILAINNSHNGARLALSRLNGGAPMNYTTPPAATGYAPATSFVADHTSAAPEQPAAPRPVKRSKKKKRIAKPAVVQAPMLPQESEPAPVASAIPAAAPVATPKSVVPIANAPAPQAPITAPKPVATMPALPTVPAAAAPSIAGLPPLPKP